MPNLMITLTWHKFANHIGGLRSIDIQINYFDLHTKQILY